MKTKKRFLLIAIITIIVLIITSLAVAKNKSNKPKSDYDEFAKCLTEKDAIMYGVYWCKYCNIQKKEFGDSFQYINYVECSEEPDECTEKGIDGFPTWIINSQKYEGRQPLQKLSSLTECRLDEVKNE